MNREGWVIWNTCEGTFLCTKYSYDSYKGPWTSFEKARLFNRKSDAQKCLDRLKLNKANLKVERVIIWFPNDKEE